MGECISGGGFSLVVGVKELYFMGWDLNRLKGGEYLSFILDCKGLERIQ